MGEVRQTRHTGRKTDSLGLTLHENGLFWNGKFWPHEPHDVIGRRMGTIKSLPRNLLADPSREVEVTWMEEVHKDIWAMVFMKNMDKLEQSSIGVDEQLATLRQNHELGRLRSFDLADPNLPKSVLEKREKCQEMKRKIGDLMDDLLQRSARVRDKRRTYVISTQEDDLIGTLIVNPLHEKAAAALATLKEEEESREDIVPVGANAATINRKKREKEKKARPNTTTMIPSMPNLMNELNFFTDEVVEGCQIVQNFSEPSEASLEQCAVGVANILLFCRNLVSTGELIFYGNYGLPAQSEEKQKELTRVGQELNSVVDRVVQVFVKGVTSYTDLKDWERRSASEEKLERLKRKMDDHFRNLRSASALAHKYTEEFTGLALSIEQ